MVLLWWSSKVKKGLCESNCAVKVIQLWLCYYDNDGKKVDDGKKILLMVTGTNSSCNSNKTC